VVTGVEEARTGADPDATVLANARAKARAGLRERPAATVLGADTDVEIDGRLLGKASDVDGARRRLQALSGRTHEVVSALVLLDADEGAERSGVERSRVTFRPLGEPFLERYLASGEWRDRAGAYAVQGLGAAMVESVEGELANVIGLPVNLFIQLAPQFFAKP
jgi:septum formation protein